MLKERLAFQAFDPDDPSSFILGAANLARVQQFVFQAMLEGLPEIIDPVMINGRLPVFRAKVDRIAERFHRRFPEKARRHSKV